MLSDACFEFCSQLLDVIRPVHAVLLLRGLLASFHKNLRFCDLCKELAFGTPESLRPNQDFIQLVPAQHVLPPVPEKLRIGPVPSGASTQVALPTVLSINHLGFNRSAGIALMGCPSTTQEIARVRTV